VLDNIRIVLVGTSHSGNLGSVARAMKTMGLVRLSLVAPRTQVDAHARALASGADDILDRLEWFPDLDQAVADCHWVMGASARSRRIEVPLLSPDDAGTAAVARASGDQQVALVFGREDRGLTNEELNLCHAHVHIPSSPDFSSLNLAAAVQVLTWSVRKAWLSGVAQGAGTVERNMADVPLASIDQINRMLDHWQEMLVAAGFLDPDKPRLVMPRFRRMFLRAGLRHDEVQMLRGVMTEVLKKIRSQ
jgi:tRNA (cytidine32/uridine32-2'-O)-methyltransferase